MDEYTKYSKAWLDGRFRQVDEDGIYIALQPIYGFRKGHSEPGSVERYIRTYQIMKALSHLNFRSLLDVGGGEGFKAYIAKQLFGVRVTISDLSEEACKRSEEIFHIKSVPADIHKLPFKDGEYDVVLCSEALEHVADFRGAVEEVLRVARMGAVITVPHEAENVIESNIEQIEQGESLAYLHHFHIHHFNLKSFNYLRDQLGYIVNSKPMIHPLIRIPAGVIEAAPPSENVVKMYPRALLMAYSALIPVIKKITGKRTAAALIHFDEWLCRQSKSHTALLFVILKDKSFQIVSNKTKISASKIMNFSVPYHYINNGVSQ